MIIPAILAAAGFGFLGVLFGARKRKRLTLPTPQVISYEPSAPYVPTYVPTTVKSMTNVLRIMNRLITVHGYSREAAAGIVGNILAESGAIPNRVEGSTSSAPMRSRGFDGEMHDWTPDEIANRSASAGRGPKLPGVGLAQWTSASRRAGLFAYRGLGPNILYDLEAQVDYLVQELRTSYKSVNTVLTRSGVSVDDASDEVVYRFEVPGSILSGGQRLPRTDSKVQFIFDARRTLSRQALSEWAAAAAAQPRV